MPIRNAFVAAFACAAFARAAHAESTCEADHLRAQEARAAGKLVEARDALLLCSRRDCPNLVQEDCVGWLAEVKADTPTIVLDAKDDRGARVKPSSIRIDGAPITTGLDGQALEIDPGDHEVVFEATGLATVTVHVLAKAGTKNQTVTATFVTTPPPRGGSKLPAFILFGVAGASLLTFGGLAIAGQVEFDGFDACKPGCVQDDVDRVEREFIAADVMLGVAGAALATGVVLFFVLPGAKAAPTSASLAVRPSAAGAALRLSVPF